MANQRFLEASGFASNLKQRDQRASWQNRLAGHGHGRAPYKGRSADAAARRPWSDLGRQHHDLQYDTIKDLGWLGWSGMINWMTYGFGMLWTGVKIVLHRHEPKLAITFVSRKPFKLIESFQTQRLGCFWAAYYCDSLGRARCACKVSRSRFPVLPNPHPTS